MGIPFTEDGMSEEKSTETSVTRSNGSQKEKVVLNVRSLSLELAKHKHKLAAQLVSVPPVGSTHTVRVIERLAKFSFAWVW